MVEVKKNGREEFEVFMRHNSGGRGLEHSYTWLSHLEIGDKINLGVSCVNCSLMASLVH